MLLPVEHWSSDLRAKSSGTWERNRVTAVSATENGSLPQESEKVKVSATQLCLTLCAPWTVAHRLLCPWRFSRQGYWTGLPFPSPGELPDARIKPRSPALQADPLPSELSGKPLVGFTINVWGGATMLSARQQPPCLYPIPGVQVIAAAAPWEEPVMMGMFLKRWKGLNETFLLNGIQ